MMVKMAENIKLVNDVKTLFLQPGHEPGLLLSDNYAAKEFSSKIGVPVFLGNSTSGDLSGISNIINSTPFIADSCNYLENSAQTTQFVGEMSGSLARQIQDNLQSNGAAFNASSSGQSHIKLYDDLKAKFAMRMKSNSTLTNELVAKAELLSLHPEMMMNQQACLHLPRSDQLPSSSSSTVDSGSLRWLEKGILSNAGIQGHFGTPNVSSGMLTSVPRTNTNMISSSHDDPGDHLTTNHMLVYNSFSGHYFTDDRSAMRELNVCNERMANKIIQAHGIPLSKHDKHKNSGELPPGFVLANRNHEFGESQSFKNTEFEDACIGPQSGDDLFDNLGTEDLNQPRQMLVEMLCEESGLFLEIADIIRGLGLTILKGVMETGNDKIWVHFAVEANRDVTRMEIFVSLVNLLEKNAKGGVQPAKGISKNIP